MLMPESMQAELTQLLEAGATRDTRARVTELCAQVGFYEPERSCVNILLLQELLGNSSVVAAATAQSLDCADPDMTLNNLERCAQQVEPAQLYSCLAHADNRRTLLIVLGASSFLTNVICRYPHVLPSLFLTTDIFVVKDTAQMVRELNEMLDGRDDFAALQQVLRQYKYREVLRIGTLDLSLEAPLEYVTAELSSLAAASLQVAVAFCECLLHREYGCPLLDEPRSDEGAEAELTVLGMGKLGGNELNFSSDIDLIFFYTSSHGTTSGIKGRKDSRIDLHNYFVKLAEMVKRAINQVTEDGFVFRVDLDLRPSGRHGEIACSVAAAEAYYESWGQNWERSAMMKARPVAGSLELGERILKILEPFIYRRYHDYGMVEDLKQMKLKIDSSLTKRHESETNLKLGRGGIREIEFFIQALQLVYAGKNPHVRERSSLKALQLLHDEGYLSEKEIQFLRQAYIFLRTAEHRIQVVQERQTHSLPKGAREMHLLARRCGFGDATAFMRELELHRGNVTRLYRDLFYSSEEEIRDEISTEICFLFDHTTDSEVARGILEGNGFVEVDVAFDSLMRLCEGTIGPPMTRPVRRYYDRIAPLLMQEVLSSPEPDMALRYLERFLQSLHARGTFYALLAENHNIIHILISLFGTSTLLSRFFIQHPELLDSLVSSGYAESYKTAERQRTELQERLEGYTDNYEGQLDALRRFRNEEFLRIALNDLKGSTVIGVGPNQLSGLACVCLEAAVKIAYAQMPRRFGVPYYHDTDGNLVEAELAVQAMGKLGGLELNYHSDLDIIFMFSDRGHTLPIPGEPEDSFRQLTNQEYFSKLCQRVISALTLMTSEGRVYEIDTRLRPSGNQGPLVTSLDAYEDYHRTRAQIWERQALTKARIVVGSPFMLERIEKINTSITWEAQVPLELRAEIFHLRERMEREIAREDRGHLNIKTGRGGLVDVEFLTQYIQLKYGATYPRIRQPNTLKALQMIRQEKLLPAVVSRKLISGYAYLRRLENKLRLVHDQSINEIATDRHNLRRLARLMGCSGTSRPSEELFYAEYQEQTSTLRRLFNQYLNPALVEPETDKETE
ncbi:MAG: bifunctional [glutamate--ammonia ligase]-adenylyl-L-tyrosine phosphorylase/[glutamate--ammonia-ligase] adenylyltransferase [Desulfuromonas sp.]|nr:bifunctional [glutamate--ammonia ligase]-adenylyl-L-tyrosine phosphorylase/[glutamate--ammonia-ligase] adenylyltransferase [Desulfuromonas sp.]